MITTEERHVQENVMFYSPTKTFDQLNSLGKWAECFGDPLDGENLIVEHLHEFSFQNVQTTIGSYLAFGVCELSHICSYAKNSRECANVKLNNCCKHKRSFLHEHKKVYSYQKQHLWYSCKVCIEVAIIDWSQHPDMNSRYNKNDHYPFDIIFSHTLIISKLHDSCV